MVLAVNKVDRIADKSRLLPFLRELAEKRSFSEVVPLAAIDGDNVVALEQVITRLLPVGDLLFPTEQITTASERFLAAELIREKLTRLLREELPYALTVEIERFADEGRLARIHAVVWVERETQKGIVIGEKGATLREVGRQAREDMERLFDRKVFLQTWVKVREAGPTTRGRYVAWDTPTRGILEPPRRSPGSFASCVCCCNPPSFCIAVLIAIPACCWKRSVTSMVAWGWWRVAPHPLARD